MKTSNMESNLVDSNPAKVPGKPIIRRILPDIFAFGVGLSVAYFLKWETGDLVWSLWLCSLVLGYLTILSTIGGAAYIGLHVIRHKDFKKEQRIPAILIGGGIGLFFLGFFSVHFCGFHAGHSVFLRHFFPIQGMPEDGFGRAFMNPPLLWVMVFKHLMKPYGLFLIPAIIAERNHVFKTLIKTVRNVQEGDSPDLRIKDVIGGKKGKKKGFIGNAMGRPYINVVRMHLLIFFFAICHALKVDSFIIYAVVYFVYFFPWSVIKKPMISKKTAENNS